MEMTEDQVRSQVLAAFQQNTLYSEEKLGLDRDLEAELGIDSVVLAGVVVDVHRKLELPAGSLSAGGVRTIRELIEKARRVARPGGALAEAPAAAPSPLASQRAAAAEPAVRGDVSMAAAATPAFLRQEVERLAGLQPGEVAPDRTFLSLGMPHSVQERLLGGIQRSLKLASTLRLEDCDTVEKLTAFVSAAARHAPVPVGEAASPLPPTSEDRDGRSMKDFVELPDPDLFAKVRAFRPFFRRRQSDQLFWYGMPLETPCRNRSVIYDEITGRRREFLMFASNNYLGLANHPKVVEAVCDATRLYGSTNTGCRLIGGTNVLHKELERRLARFKGTEACIIYPSGYSANLGAISALVRRGDAVIVDKYNHMSIVDGCRLSGGQRKIYGHNDMKDLERVLASCDQGVDGKLIVTDGVFSMHGDVCDLPEIVRLARRYGARVLVDDAHSTGVLGARGSGTAEHFGLVGGKDVDLEVGTMSKTLAGLGGFVCADEEVVEYLRFYSNSYVFAANIPAGVAAGLIAALDVLEAEPQRIALLWRNVRKLKSALEGLGFDTGGANSAIVPIVIGDDRKTLEMGRAVRARGLFCQTVVFPGVSVGDARLRISVSSEHTDEDLALALDICESAAREVGVLPAGERRAAAPGAVA